MVQAAWGFIFLERLGRYKTNNELTMFRAIDFENTSFIHTVQIQATLHFF